jgi:hypothetical protein
VGQTLHQHGASQRCRPGVFISCARKDFEIIDYYTESLYKRLRELFWIDRDFLIVLWASEIIGAIENSEILLLFVTLAFRDNSYCFSELAHAITKNKRIFGILVERPMSPLLQDKFYPSGKFWQSKKYMEIFRYDDLKVRGDYPKVIVISVPLNEGRS